MRKIVLSVLTLLVSVNVLAASSDLGSAISKNLNKQNNAVGQNPPSMIYGGKDSGWHGTGLFGNTYEACLKYCEREKITKQYCPCETLFKGKK